MGKWTLTLVGKEVESDLSEVWTDLIDALNEKGHKVSVARIRTDAGEQVVNLHPEDEEPTEPEPEPVDPDEDPALNPALDPEPVASIPAETGA